MRMRCFPRLRETPSSFRSREVKAMQDSLGRRLQLSTQTRSGLCSDTDDQLSRSSTDPMASGQ